MNHYSRYYFWGDPLGYPLKRVDYEAEVQEIRKLIENNLSHEGVNHGLTFFETWLKSSGVGLGPCPDIISRMSYLGVSPKELLIEALAVWLYGERCLYLSRGIIKSDRHRLYVLGQRILRYRPGGGYRDKGPKYRETGEYIQRHIGILLINVAKSIIQKEEKDHQDKVDMAKPLNV